jgi:hypothetical protein
MTDTLRDLWDGIDAGPPRLTDVAVTSGRLRRRRRTWTALGVAVAAVAVAVGGALVQRELSGGVDAASGGLPAPPTGMRWVGMNDVVVAVPDWWTTGETQCLAPVEDTVYFDQAAQAECDDPADPATVREVSALAVLDGTCCYGELKIRSMDPVGEADGRDVVELAGCEGWFAGVCRRLFAVPDEGVVFAVTIAEEGDGDYEAIRDSAQILPDGLTTVPLRVGSGFTPGWATEPSLVDDVVAAVEAAGLRAEVETQVPNRRDDVGLTGSLPKGSLLEVSPSPGSVIEDGGTVTITVLGGS